MRIPASAPQDVKDSFSEVYRALDPWIGTQNIDLKKRRFINAGEAKDDSDFITYKQLRDQVLGPLASISPSGSSSKAILYGTDAQRTASAPTPDGMLFVVTDRENVVYQAQNVAGTPTWVYVGGMMRGTLGPDTKPTNLTTADTHFLFFSTDYFRAYRWTGSAWEDAPGAPTRFMIAFFGGTPTPITGWQLCDGSTVTRSNSTGGTTASFTVPNMISAKRFLRSHSVIGGTGGSATTHTHTVDPPSTGTSGPVSSITDVDNGGGQEVQSGTGVTVAAHTHDHNMDHVHAVDIASFASGGPSGSGGDDALPPYYEATPYIRL